MSLDLNHYPLSALLTPILKSNTADPWQVQDTDFWCVVTPPRHELRRQGWKLHVSATPLSCAQVLIRAATVLVEHGCAFKFAATLKQVSSLVSLRADRAGSGKFLTAYPDDDEHLHRVATELHEATFGLPGPAILSDLPYAQGGLVHYRYGAFRGSQRLSNDGVWETTLEAPDGRQVADHRKPWFSAPPWVPALFDGAEPPQGPVQQVLLNDRFLVQEAIRHANRGGIYRATDLTTGATVIVKQARAHVGSTLSGIDARDMLRREAAMLDLLRGLAPQLICLFDQGNDLFLVEEQVPGQTLLAHMRQHQPSQGGISVAEATMLTARLLDLLEQIHSRAIVCRDFTPSNIMVGPHGDLTLLDPELATPPHTPALQAFTPGYAAPEQSTGLAIDLAPATEADLFALGAIVLQLVTGASPAFLPDHGNARDAAQRAATILRLAGNNYPAAQLFQPIICRLMAHNPGERWPIQQIRRELDRLPARARRPRNKPAPPFLDRLIDDLLWNITEPLKDLTTDSKWPLARPHQRVDASSMEHGAGGVLAVLVKAAQVLDAPCLRKVIARTCRWLDARLDINGQSLPGLYAGRSGTMCALHDAAMFLGDEALAEKTLRVARQIPVQWPSPGISNGLAGAGLANLHLWHNSGRHVFLHRAEACAEALVQAMRRDLDGVFWQTPADFDSVLAGQSHNGLAHGLAGIGTFLQAAGTFLQRDEWIETAKQIAETLCGAARLTDNAASWPITRHGAHASIPVHDRHTGAAGIGSFLLASFHVHREERFRRFAEAAAETAWRARWTATPSMWHGRASHGEFMLDMHDVLGGEHRRQANHLAACTLSQAAIHDGRMVTPDDSGRVSLGYASGLSGTLAFLIRLRHGGAPAWSADSPIHILSRARRADASR